MSKTATRHKVLSLGDLVPEIDLDQFKAFWITACVSVIFIPIYPIISSFSYLFNKFWIRNFDANFFNYVTDLSLMKISVSVILLLTMLIVLVVLWGFMFLANVMSYYVFRPFFLAGSDVRRTLHDSISDAIGWQFWILWFGTLPLFLALGAGLDANVVVGVLVAAVNIMVYSHVLLKFRSQGVGVFYQVRPLLFSYALLSVLAAVLLLVLYSYLISFPMTWFQQDLWRYYGVGDSDILKIEQSIANFRSLDSVGESLNWSFSHVILGTMVLWLIPMFISKDWVGLVLLLFAILGPQFTKQLENLITPVFSLLRNGAPYVPQGLFSLSMAVLAALIYDTAKKRIRRGLSCTTCTARNPVTHRFCSNCGAGLKKEQVQA